MGEGAHAGTAMGQTGRTGRRSGFLEFGRLELCQWADDLCRWRDDFSSLKVTRHAGDFSRLGRKELAALAGSREGASNSTRRMAMLAVRKTARGVGNVEVQDMPEQIGVMPDR